MKRIYLIISRTNTKIGALIRAVTRFDYNHVSIALEQDLIPMYSFARYHQNNPFNGGFVEESIRRYLTEKKDVEFVIFPIEITDECYRDLLEHLEQMKEDRDLHRYSFIEAGTSYFSFFRYESENNYNCLSFAESILRKTQVLPAQQEVKSIKDLYDYLNQQYEKEIRTISYQERDAYAWNADEFLK